MKKEIRIIDVGNRYGNINLSAQFFPESFTLDDIRKVFNIAREAIGRDYGFDGHKLYAADQINNDGSFFEITPEYVEAYPEGWTSINEDILVMSDKVDDAAIGHPIADCPVVIAHDKIKKVVSIGHCGTFHTNLYLPIAVVDALAKSHNSKDEDIEIFVTAGVEKETYIKEEYPVYLDNEFWHKHIYQDEDGLYHIDLKSTIYDELISRNIKVENIKISNVDTITDPHYFSHYASNHGHPKKAGNNFAGATFNKKR